jgi:hypothetical protein
MSTLEQANAFLEQEYTAEFNQRFQVPALQAGSAFLPCQRKDLDVLFSVQQVRVVSRDNTVVVGGQTLQIEATHTGDANRIYLGRSPERINAEGNPVIQFLDADGKVTNEFTGSK